MAIEKYAAPVADSVLKNAAYNTFDFARLAHINHLVDQINNSAPTIPAVLGTTVNITSSAGTFAVPGEPTSAEVDATIDEATAKVEARLDAIEAKLDALITALTA